MMLVDTFPCFFVDFEDAVAGRTVDVVAPVHPDRDEKNLKDHRLPFTCRTTSGKDLSAHYVFSAGHTPTIPRKMLFTASSSCIGDIDIIVKLGIKPLSQRVAPRVERIVWHSRRLTQDISNERTAILHLRSYADWFQSIRSGQT